MTVVDKIEITVLVDDHPGEEGLYHEHGLAFWIEADGHCLLFDTGAGEALEFNASKLGIDLCQAEAVILSHGHYDHTGALHRVLRQKPDMGIYCHPGVIRERYSIRPDNIKAAGMPAEAREAICALPSGQVHWHSDSRVLFEGCGLTGSIPRCHTFEDTGGPFFLDAESRRKDMLEDDQALWLRTARGVVIVLGCCHSGLLNTVEYVQKLSGEERIYAIIGGMHLLHADHARLEKTCQAIARWQPEYLIPCHCTGDEVIPLLAARFPDSFTSCHVGTGIEL